MGFPQPTNRMLVKVTAHCGSAAERCQDEKDCSSFGTLAEACAPDENYFGVEMKGWGLIHQSNSSSSI